MKTWDVLYDFFLPSYPFFFFIFFTLSHAMHGKLFCGINAPPVWLSAYLSIYAMLWIYFCTFLILCGSWFFLLGSSSMMTQNPIKLNIIIQTFELTQIVYVTLNPLPYLTSLRERRDIRNNGITRSEESEESHVHIVSFALAPFWLISHKILLMFWINKFFGISFMIYYCFMFSYQLKLIFWLLW